MRKERARPVRTVAPPPPEGPPSDERFMGMIDGTTPEGWYDLLEQELHRYRNLTDGVTWEMVDVERERLKGRIREHAKREKVDWG